MTHCPSKSPRDNEFGGPSAPLGTKQQVETLPADGPLFPPHEFTQEVCGSACSRHHGYPPVHGNLNKSNIRRLKIPPANAARLTQLASIFVIVQVGLCPPYFIQHQTSTSKPPEFADSRIPAVLPRKTTVRGGKDLVLHSMRKLLHTKYPIHAAGGAACAP